MAPQRQYLTLTTHGALSSKCFTTTHPFYNAGSQKGGWAMETGSSFAPIPQLVSSRGAWTCACPLQHTLPSTCSVPLPWQPWPEPWELHLPRALQSHHWLVNVSQQSEPDREEWLGWGVFCLFVLTYTPFCWYNSKMISYLLCARHYWQNHYQRNRQSLLSWSLQSKGRDR